MDKDAVEKVNRLIVEIKKHKNPSSVETLYSIISPRIRFIAIKYFKASVEADDVVQDFWLDIVLYCEKAKFLTNGIAYLLRIMDNICKMRLRKNGREKSNISLDSLLDLGNDLEGLNGLNDRQIALKQTYLKAISRMSVNEKKVFYLVCYSDMTVRNIALELNISKSTADRLRQSAFLKLKKVLIADGWDKIDE